MSPCNYVSVTYKWIIEVPSYCQTYTHSSLHNLNLLVPLWNLISILNTLGAQYSKVEIHNRITKDTARVSALWKNF